MEKEQVWKAGGITLINADFMKVALPYEHIDLIITSPPYNLHMSYDNYEDHLTVSEYYQLFAQWMQKMFELLKTDGRLCLNIPLDSRKGSSTSINNYYHVLQIAEKIGFKYHTTIIWNKQTISKRTAWGSWCSASAPMVIPQIEVILVLYKSSWKKIAKGTSTIKPEEFIAWTNGVWNLPGESRKRALGHPAPFPLEIPTRCIQLFSYVEDIILDPFVGSGTTLIAAHKLGRQAIGIEISPAYYQIAIHRLSHLVSKLNLE